MPPHQPSSRLRHHSLPPAFRIDSSGAGTNACWIGISGELDSISAPELVAALQRVLGAVRLVVLDLGGLTFMDSAGIHAIVDASVAATARGDKLVVAGATPAIRSAFSASGTDQEVTVLDLPAGAGNRR